MINFSRSTAIALLLFLSAAASAQAPAVEKIEPPNWWAQHTIETVRVLIRGSGFQGARVESSSKDVAIANVKVNRSGDHVFFDARISRRARAGKVEFRITTAGGTAIAPFAIGSPLTAKPQTITNDDVIYLIMTDRFADGDASNNKDVDRKNPRAWHGGDLKGITKRIPYLKELGVTAIWLTPWYDNPDEANTCDKPWCPNTNYHGYHAIDYYAVENHFGSMADLKALVAEAGRQGIKVIQDQVANHVGVQHPWVKRPPLENWFSPFRQNPFKNSVLISPNASAAERDLVLSGWFNELLPDLNQSEPEVSRYLIQNALWWIGETGIGGIRQDTIQYMPRSFIHDWSAAIRKQYPGYWMVGEVFEEDSAHTAFFQGGRTGWDGVDTGLPSVFDFKLWRTSQEVFTGKKPASALRDVLKYDGLYPNINNVTVLANNHDTDRFMSLPGATAEGAMMHIAFILSTRGIPQLYYGEEIAMTGGHDPDNRKDFAGLTADTIGSLETAQTRMMEFTRQWIKLRRSIKALQRGATIDLHYDADSYVFARVFEEPDAIRTRRNSYALVAFNISDKVKTIGFPKGTRIGEISSSDLLKNANRHRSYPGSPDAKLTSDEKGDQQLQLPARSVAIFGMDLTLATEN